MISMKLEGVESANRAFQSLEQKIRRSVIRKALRKGANVSLESVRTEAPTRTRALQKAMRVKTERERATGTEYAEVSLNRKSKRSRRGRVIWPSKYMHLVTGGTQAHEIAPKRKRAMAFGDGEAYSRVQHPGTKADDYVGRAYNRTAKRSVQTFQREYARLVEQAVVESRTSK